MSVFVSELTIIPVPKNRVSARLQLPTPVELLAETTQLRSGVVPSCRTRLYKPPRSACKRGVRLCGFPLTLSLLSRSHCYMLHDSLYSSVSGLH